MRTDYGALNDNILYYICRYAQGPYQGSERRHPSDDGASGSSWKTSQNVYRDTKRHDAAGEDSQLIPFHGRPQPVSGSGS